MARRPTIIDVAKQAGVSKSTVSLVLRNSPSVREETRAQVRQAMADLGYVYNRAAATMRMANAGLIGLVINELRNPFFAEFATALQMALAEKGYAAVIANAGEDAGVQHQVVGSLIEHGVSAFILCPAYGETTATFDAIARAGVPAMQMLRQVDDRLEQFPFMAPDYHAGARMAARHLVEQGARKVAFVGGLEGRAVTQEREAGYRDEMQRAGLAPIVLTGDSTRAFGRASAAQLQRTQPDVDAVLCFNDLVALGMLAGFSQQGRRVGEDILVCGFDDIEEAAQSHPALSSVHCDIASIGGLAAQTVVRWLETGEQPAPSTRTPVGLSQRQSSGGAATGAG